MAWTTPRTWTTGEVVTKTIMDTHVRDNFLQAVGPAATTVTALNTAWGGTPPDGAQGLLRLGTTPFRFVPLRYDATLAKWVTEQQWVTWWMGSAGTYAWSGNTTVSTFYSGEFSLLGTEDYSLLRTAGLNCQIRFMWLMLNTSASTGGVSWEIRSVPTETGAFTSSWSGVYNSAGTFSANGGGGIGTHVSLTTTYTAIAASDTQASEWHTLGTTWDTSTAWLHIRGAIQSNASPGTTDTYVGYPKQLVRWVS